MVEPLQDAGMAVGCLVGNTIPSRNMPPHFVEYLLCENDDGRSTFAGKTCSQKQILARESSALTLQVNRNDNVGAKGCETEASY